VPFNPHCRFKGQARDLAAQIILFCVVFAIMPVDSRVVPNGGFARACRLADSHGPLTVSPSDAAVDRRVRIGQDGGAVSAVVIDRSRIVLMERCRLIVR
jgi:hypothetical protein